MTTATLEEVDFSDLDAAIAALRTHHDTFDGQKYAAADFVAAHGSLADVFDDDELTRAQAMVEEDVTWNLLAHWSKQRGDGLMSRPSTFGDHEAECDTCEWLEIVLAVSESLREHGCPDCGRKVDGHVFAPAPVWDGDVPQEPDWPAGGAYCKEPWTRYLEPLVEPPGRLGAYQISEACSARWAAPLTNGSHALLYRTYYRTRVEGEVFIEREDWYVVCLDLDDPEGSKAMENSRTEEVESEDPDGEDLLALVQQSFDPEIGEWEHFMPQAPTFHYARS